jgi:hypothetical protein
VSFISQVLLAEDSGHVAGTWQPHGSTRGPMAVVDTQCFPIHAELHPEQQPDRSWPIYCNMMERNGNYINNKNLCKTTKLPGKIEDLHNDFLFLNIFMGQHLHASCLHNTHMI